MNRENRRAYDRIKDIIQRQLFERGLTELLTAGSRIKMPEPNPEQGTKKLNRSTDRVLAHVAENIIYEEKFKGGEVSNIDYLLSIARSIGANSYTIGKESYGIMQYSKKRVPITAETFIPIVFYRSSRV